MRNLGIISLVFVILLSLIPCNDELEINEFVKNTFITTPHDSNNCTTEMCSVLCVCNCCGQNFVEIDVAIMAVKPAVYALPKKAPNCQFLILQLSNNIWHPPKVG